MLKLPHKDLPVEAQQNLAKWQHEIDTIAIFEEKVKIAKQRFSEKNKATNPTFRQVRSTLADMCSGAQRCGYCEDSYADEVEHIKPKDWYPEFTFVWENYLYACGQCNSGKSNQYAIFRAEDQKLTVLKRAKTSPVVAPDQGEHVLIDPRKEDPLDNMELDLRGTFRLVPKAEDVTSKAYIRAKYTIDTLRLNTRDALLKARENEYRSYVARLEQYIRSRDAGASQTELDRLVTALQRMGHPTVWREMQRQHPLITELKQLFHQAPEALNW